MANVKVKDVVVTGVKVSEVDATVRCEHDIIIPTPAGTADIDYKCNPKIDVAYKMKGRKSCKAVAHDAGVKVSKIYYIHKKLYNSIEISKAEEDILFRGMDKGSHVQREYFHTILGYVPAAGAKRGRKKGSGKGSGSTGAAPTAPSPVYPPKTPLTGSGSAAAIIPSSAPHIEANKESGHEDKFDSKVNRDGRKRVVDKPEKVTIKRISDFFD